MTSAVHLAASRPELKEFDSVKESISDIINQLRDIDPARLSFSPFLDLDTQISLAPVSDSPESSVEELHSLSRSPAESRHSLEPPPAGDCAAPSGQLDRTPSSESFDQQQRQQEDAEAAVAVAAVASEISFLDRAAGDAPGNGTTTPLPEFRDEFPKGARSDGWGPLESTNQESTVEEDRPLISPPPETIELTVWDSQAQPEGGAVPNVAERGRCRRCCCSSRFRALCSVLASLLVLPGILYGLYFYLPLESPLCPDLASRLVFAIRCCVVAAVPLLLAVLTGAVSRLCTSASLDPLEPCPRGPALQQRFVAGSVEQLALYALNLVVMATFLPQEQLRVVPILAGLFVVGRLAYWMCLHMCSSGRGFGSGLTVFPLLAMMVFNLFYLFDLEIGHLLPRAGEANSTQTTPTPQPGLEPLGG
nr:PREDICTED: transmembrane protein 79-like [Lepisosteus oculatus]XP_015221102.1 PREDICTED: transmembrane protein 79-like [Lepisosteus oculatus]